ncbi:MAG: hypothetical protein AB1793_09445 [Candidatus Thermoplasmatota archaeon]
MEAKLVQPHRIPRAFNYDETILALWVRPMPVEHDFALGKPVGELPLAVEFDLVGMQTPTGIAERTPLRVVESHPHTSPEEASQRPASGLEQTSGLREDAPTAQKGMGRFESQGLGIGTEALVSRRRCDDPAGTGVQTGCSSFDRLEHPGGGGVIVVLELGGELHHISASAMAEAPPDTTGKVHPKRAPVVPIATVTRQRAGTDEFIV